MFYLTTACGKRQPATPLSPDGSTFPSMRGIAREKLSVREILEPSCDTEQSAPSLLLNRAIERSETLTEQGQPMLIGLTKIKLQQ